MIPQFALPYSITDAGRRSYRPHQRKYRHRWLPRVDKRHGWHDQKGMNGGRT